jgi:hypothetical protein
MTPTEREYQIHLAKRNQQSQNAQIRNAEIINKKVMRKGTTTDNRIPNMRDAYSSVRSNDHQPTPEEIDFLRFTSGSYVDCK